MKKQTSCDLCGESSYETKHEKCNCCEHEKPIRVRFCPNCKSTNVKFVFELKNLFGLVPRIRCAKCGNQSVDFPILIVDKKNLEKKKTTKQTKNKRNKK